MLDVISPPWTQPSQGLAGQRRLSIVDIVVKSTLNYRARMLRHLVAPNMSPAKRGPLDSRASLMDGVPESFECGRSLAELKTH